MDARRSPALLGPWASEDVIRVGISSCPWIRHYVVRLGVEYLADPVYLEPHPQEPMLRNHV